MDSNDTVVPQPPQEESPQKEEAQQEVQTAEQPEAASAAPAGAKWYVVHVKTGYESRVRQGLEQRTKSLGVDDKIFDIVIPQRETVVVKKGKKSKIKEKVFPGYVLVRMILDDNSWLVVRTTEGVTGFVGAGLKPTPISDREVAAIMKFISQEQPKFKTKFSTGEAVKIIEGPFADFLGTIEAIDEQRGKVKVLVSIFDRETPVELDFLQVAKL
jgi:transcriptional antiterminator NusG